jgi:hypothetical protein
VPAVRRVSPGRWKPARDAQSLPPLNEIETCSRLRGAYGATGHSPLHGTQNKESHAPVPLERALDDLQRLAHAGRDGIRGRSERVDSRGRGREVQGLYRAAGGGGHGGREGSRRMASAAARRTAPGDEQAVAGALRNASCRFTIPTAD